MLRRLAQHQPETFAFTPDNQAWAEAQITKYPEGRQASAIIPLLWRAQEQEGWLSRPAIEHVADMLGLAYIRALEVATFYFMFQLHPVGKIANVQVCGTLSCMLQGSEGLIEACQTRIAKNPHELSSDGNFSWEEVECLGACCNAPMVQIGKDYYEDLSPERLVEIIDEMAAGRVPAPGSQMGRFSSEPIDGLTTLDDVPQGEAEEHNGSVALALKLGDTIKRIDGSEVPLTHPWQGVQTPAQLPPEVSAVTIATEQPEPAAGKPADETGVTKQQAEAVSKGGPQGANESGTPANKAEMAKPSDNSTPPNPKAGDETVGTQPVSLEEPRGGKADDLKKIKGIGPKLEEQLHSMGFFHFEQIANWSTEEVAWIDEHLEGFRGRASRDDWRGQAQALTQGGGSDTGAKS